MKKELKICPSILAGDFGRIADEAQRIEQSGADWLHVDVMDGHFVSNLTIGPQVVAAINRSTSMFLDVHLMMYNPFDYIEKFVEAGADMITFHFEATEEVEEILNYIRRCNVRCGLAFKPETSMSFIPKFLPLCDMILLMTVPPGFGGQHFMPEVVEKIRYTRYTCNVLGIRAGGVVVGKEDIDKTLPFDIEVDGGITADTAKVCAQAGANIFVAGSYLFQDNNMSSRVNDMKQVVTANFCERVVPIVANG